MSAGGASGAGAGTGAGTGAANGKTARGLYIHTTAAGDRARVRFRERISFPCSTQRKVVQSAATGGGGADRVWENHQSHPDF